MPLLALAEFAYNIAVESSTGKVPLEIVSGEIPRSTCSPWMKSNNTVPPRKALLKVKA